MSDEIKSGDTKDLEFKMAEGSKPLIPDGEYSVQYVNYERGNIHGNEKLYLYFSIVDQGPHFNVRLRKNYNYYSSPPCGSDLHKDLSLLLGRPFKKNTRISLEVFKNSVLRIKTRTVTHDRKQNPYAEHTRYSVIDAILGKETGPYSGGK